jgi:hypothetical protein
MVVTAWYIIFLCNYHQIWNFYNKAWQVSAVSVHKNQCSFFNCSFIKVIYFGLPIIASLILVLKQHLWRHRFTTNDDFYNLQFINHFPKIHAKYKVIGLLCSCPPVWLYKNNGVPQGRGFLMVICLRSLEKWLLLKLGKNY